MDRPRIEQSQADYSQVLEKILSMSAQYMDKLEKNITIVTKAVSEADKMRQHFIEKEKELTESFWSKLTPNLIPFFWIIAFVVGLYFLPCGIKFNGFGVQVSTAECVKK